MLGKATLAGAHAYDDAPTHTYARTRTEICNTYRFYTEKKWFRERASVLRYTYIARLFLFCS